MKVCVITENFLPKIDGVTRTLARLLDHLLDQGDQVLIIGPKKNIDTYKGIEVCGTPGIELFFYPELRTNFFKPSLLQKIRDFNADVFHFVDPILLGPQFLIVCQLCFPEIPRVTSYHTNIALYASNFGFPVFKYPIWALQRMIHNSCSLVLCPSPSTSKELETQGFEVSKVIIWPRGVDISLFNPLQRSIELRQSWFDVSGIRSNRVNDDIVLLYVGRLSWEKNLRLLAEIYLHLSKFGVGEIPSQNFHLVLVGDGPARSDLEHLLYGLKVTFTGYLEGQDLAASYASSDIFVFPSESETFGQVVLEAMASGLPVISLNAEGVCDLVIDGATGYLANPSNSREEQKKEMLGMIYSLAADCHKRYTIGCQAIKHAQRFSWTTAMDIARNCYEKSIATSATTSLWKAKICGKSSEKPLYNGGDRFYDASDIDYEIYRFDQDHDNQNIRRISTREMIALEAHDPIPYPTPFKVAMQWLLFHPVESSLAALLVFIMSIVCIISVFTRPFRR